MAQRFKVKLLFTERVFELIGIDNARSEQNFPKPELFLIFSQDPAQIDGRNQVQIA